MNKTIWITGASSGIGRSLTLEYSKAPVNLILSSRNENKLNELKKKMKHQDHIQVLPFDLSQPHSLLRCLPKGPCG